eukprot:683142-Rhodomonas_salina.25
MSHEPQSRDTMAPLVFRSDRRNQGIKERGEGRRGGPPSAAGRAPRSSCGSSPSPSFASSAPS